MNSGPNYRHVKVNHKVKTRQSGRSEADKVNNKHIEPLFWCTFSSCTWCWNEEDWPGDCPAITAVTITFCFYKRGEIRGQMLN